MGKKEQMLFFLEKSLLIFYLILRFKLFLHWFIITMNKLCLMIFDIEWILFFCLWFKKQYVVRGCRIDSTSTHGAVLLKLGLSSQLNWPMFGLDYGCWKIFWWNDRTYVRSKEQLKQIRIANRLWRSIRASMVRLGDVKNKELCFKIKNECIFERSKIHIISKYFFNLKILVRVSAVMGLISSKGLWD